MKNFRGIIVRLLVCFFVLSHFFVYVSCLHKRLLSKDRLCCDRDGLNAMLRAGTGRYITWSRLLRRVFNLDMETCPNCGGTVKVIAAIEEPAVIKKILTHLGLSPHPLAKFPAGLHKVKFGF